MSVTPVMACPQHDDLVVMQPGTIWPEDSPRLLFCLYCPLCDPECRDPFKPGDGIQT